MNNQLLIIQCWHMVEESCNHGKIVITFTDKPHIIIDNRNEQKYLYCYVNGEILCCTHIESFVTDFAYLIDNLNNIQIYEYDNIKHNKRKSIVKHQTLSNKRICLLSN